MSDSKDKAPKKAEEVSKAEPKKAEPVKVKPARQVTFETYCTQRGVHPRHRAGMKAFTKMQRASMAEWDAIFKAY